MNKQIEYFNNTPKRDFIDCRITNLRDYFNYYGLELDSYDLFILGQAIDCSRIKYRIKDDSPIELMLLGVCNSNFEITLFENLEMEYDICYYLEDIKSIIERRINANEPIYSTVDIRYLLNPQYQCKEMEIHCVSSVLVCGYDYGEDSFVYLNMKAEKNGPLRMIPLNAYEKAIGSKLFPQLSKKTIYVPKIDKETIYRVRFNYKEYVLKSLKRVCTKLLNESCICLDNESKYNCLEFGIHLLEDIVERNLEIVNLAIDESVKLKILVLHIRSLRDMMVTGSNYCYRTEFSESLIRVARKLEIKELKVIGGEFKKISQKWRILSRKFYIDTKFFNKTSMKKYVELVNNLMLEICEEEKELFKKLLLVVESEVG